MATGFAGGAFFLFAQRHKIRKTLLDLGNVLLVVIVIYRAFPFLHQRKGFGQALAQHCCGYLRPIGANLGT